MNDAIDYGEVITPKSWKDISLRKFQDIQRYYDDKEEDFNIIDVLDILIDKDKDYIMSLPAQFCESILANLTFMATQPEIGDATNKITINGEEYIINIQNKLKVGEYVAVDTVLKADKHNYASILAILCRKKDEIYDSKFENEILEDRIKLFEEQPITNILPLIGFFLNLYMVLEIPFRLYSQAEEGINHIQRIIDNSQRIGASKKLYLTWRMKKLKKSLKSIKFT